MNTGMYTGNRGLAENYTISCNFVTHLVRTLNQVTGEQHSICVERTHDVSNHMM